MNMIGVGLLIVLVDIWGTGYFLHVNTHGWMIMPCILTSVLLARVGLFFILYPDMSK